MEGGARGFPCSLSQCLNPGFPITCRPQAVKFMLTLTPFIVTRERDLAAFGSPYWLPRNCTVGAGLAAATGLGAAGAGLGLALGAGASWMVMPRASADSSDFS